MTIPATVPVFTEEELCSLKYDVIVRYDESKNRRISVSRCKDEDLLALTVHGNGVPRTGVFAITNGRHVNMVARALLDSPYDIGLIR